MVFAEMSALNEGLELPDHPGHDAERVVSVYLALFQMSTTGVDQWFGIERPSPVEPSFDEALDMLVLPVASNSIHILIQAARNVAAAAKQLMMVTVLVGYRDRIDSRCRPETERSLAERSRNLCWSCRAAGFVVDLVKDPVLRG